MAQILRQSTEVIVVIGPFVDKADGLTPETGIDLSTADEAELLKANTTTTTSIAAATWAAITGCDGWYGLTLTTSLTDTVGALTVMVNDDSVCLPVFARFQVIEEAAYDAMYAASANPKADINVASIDADAITATAIANDALTAAKVASDVGTEIGTAVWATATRALTVLDEDSTTLDLDATIRAAVGLAAADLDTQLAALPTAAENADAVWDEAATGHTDAGKAGEQLWTDVDAILTDTGTTLQGEVDGIQADTEDIQATLAGGVAVASIATGAITADAIAANAIGASEIADGAIDAATFAAGAITAAALAADAGAEIADAVLDRDMSAGTDSGSTTVRTPRQALRAIRNKVGIAGGTLTVTKEDDATASWTAAVTTAAGDPISEVDPAGP